jgi:MFS family permease
LHTHPTAQQVVTRPTSLTQSTLICLALLLEGMSASSINVQVAAVRDALDIGPTGLGIVVAAFLIAYAGLLPTAGRLVDVRDRRTVFLLGVALFGIGCVLCAASVTTQMLVSGRLIQGAGAALSAPAALALITHGLPQGAHRNRAVAIYGAMGAAGFSLGLVLPGFVVAAFGWRASFALLLPIVVVVLVASWRLPRGSRVTGESIDLTGAAILTGVLMLSVHLIGGAAGQPLRVTLVEGCLVVLLVVLLVRRGGVAGFPVRVATESRVLSACVALGAVFAGAIASYYVLSLALQSAYEHGPFDVGLALLPNPVAFAVLAGYGARLVTRLGAGPVLGVGMTMIAASLAFLAGPGLDAPSHLGMLPAQIAIGAGLALAFPAASILAVDAVSQEFRGTTAGLLTTWQNVGGAVGLALVTALGVVPTDDHAEAGPGLAFCAALVVAGGAIAMVIARSGQARKGTHR